MKFLSFLAAMLMILIRSWTFLYRILNRKEHLPPQGFVFCEHFWRDLFSKYIFANSRILRMRSCAYYPKYGFGAFGIYPVLLKKRFVRICKTILWVVVHLSQWHYVYKAYWSYRVSSEDYGLMGLRYGSANLSFGSTFVPLSCMWRAI